MYESTKSSSLRAGGRPRARARPVGVNRYLQWAGSALVRDLARKFALQNAVQHDGKADVKAVVGRLLATDASLRAKAAEVRAEVEKIVTAVNALTAEAQREELERTAPELLERKKPEVHAGLPDLSGVTGPVVMRLAPFPSGPLHIGNARMVVLNDEYVRRYGGKLILAYDDTIGSEEKFILPEAYDQIREGLDWLGVNVHEVVYKSDRLPLFYEWGERILAAGAAYVCECPSDRLRGLRAKAEPCEHRGRDAADSTERFRAMLRGDYREGQAIVRLKTDMAHANPAFRDRVLFRIAEREHPRVGRKYRVWPLLEFSWAVDDHVLGITHVVRGKDLVMEDAMETAIWDALGVQRRPHFVHHGLLGLADLELSKTELRKAMERGEVTGIDDPRTWTLQSLARRGIAPEAVRTFVKSFGLSLADVTVPAETLFAENRKLIDRVADRYFFVKDPVAVRLDRLPDTASLHLSRHPDDPARGQREVPTGDTVHVSRVDFAAHRGEEVRLKDWCNVILDEAARFTSREVKDVPKIQWVAGGLPATVLMPDGTEARGLGEMALRDARPGQVVQFERFGFARLESVGDAVRAVLAHR